MLEVRGNEISLHKWSDGTAQLRASEGTLSTPYARNHSHQTLQEKLSDSLVFSAKLVHTGNFRAF